MMAIPRWLPCRKPIGSQRNWSGHYRWSPRTTLNPRSVEELQAILTRARTTGRQVRPVGSGHSFSAVAVGEDIQALTDHLSGLIDFDHRAGRVTLAAGTKLWQIPHLLAGTGWAMENLGDINRQSIAGAISTGTHGTGLRFGGLSSQLAGLAMITGDGEHLKVSDQHPQLLDALRVTLGACGVLTEVTLQLVPDYDLHTSQCLQPIDEVLDGWEQLNTDNDHFEFFWFMRSQQAVTKTSRRLPAGTVAQTQAGHSRLVQRGQDLTGLVREEVISNAGFAAICRLGNLAPQVTPRLNDLTTRGWGQSERIKNWATAFASPRRVRFNETEFAVDFQAVPEVLRELDRALRDRGLSATFPIEVRSAAADSGWLATSQGRTTGYIAVHRHASEDFADYFATVSEVMSAYQGRPHWGKWHTLTAEQCATRYEHWEDFLRVRQCLDSSGTMLSPHLREVFGL